MTLKAKHKCNLTANMDQIMSANTQYFLESVNLKKKKKKHFSWLLLFSGLGVESHKQNLNYQKITFFNYFQIKIPLLNTCYLGWGYDRGRVQ